MRTEALPYSAKWVEHRASIVAAGLCEECEKRPGTRKWGDMLAVTHGGGEMRCGVCVYGPQLRHAFSRGIRIPNLAVLLAWSWLRRA